MTEETNINKITSDVPSDKEEHDKKIHQWSERARKKEALNCFTCQLNSDDEECPHFIGQVEGVKCKNHVPTPKKYPVFAEFCIENDKGHTEFKPALVAQWLVKNEHFKNDRRNGLLYYGDQEKGI